MAPPPGNNRCKCLAYGRGSSGSDHAGGEKDPIIAVAGPSEAIRGMVVWILRDLGYECTQASNGSELVDILESQSIALAVIDVISPEFETPPAVQSARPPIILLLENGQIPGEVWRSANIFSLVIKPFSAGQIISCVTSALPRTRLIL